MILNTILSRLAPYECIGCGAEGLLVCKSCADNLVGLPERCYRCQRLSLGDRTCESCRSHSVLYAVHARTAYDSVAKDLVWRLKFSGAQAAATEMAGFMERIVPVAGNTVLVPVPTATSRARQRGYDQAQLLARAIAQQTGAHYLPCLRRLGQHHQVGATRQQRVTQLQQAYRCIKPRLIKDAHVVLVDDVLTTGATLEAAAKVIKAAGAKRVSGLVFAQA